MFRRICDVTFKCDAELRLRGVTLEDVRSFLRDTQRFDLAVNTYGNYNVLGCQC